MSTSLSSTITQQNICDDDIDQLDDCYEALPNRLHKYKLPSVKGSHIICTTRENSNNQVKSATNTSTPTIIAIAIIPKEICRLSCEPYVYKPPQSQSKTNLTTDNNISITDVSTITKSSNDTAINFATNDTASSTATKIVTVAYSNSFGRENDSALVSDTCCRDIHNEIKSDMRLENVNKNNSTHVIAVDSLNNNNSFTTQMISERKLLLNEQVIVKIVLDSKLYENSKRNEKVSLLIVSILRKEKKFLYEYSDSDTNNSNTNRVMPRQLLYTSKSTHEGILWQTTTHTYTLKRIIGRGSYGYVWHAIISANKSGSHVAIKMSEENNSHVAIKVNEEKVLGIWEAYIHSLLQYRASHQPAVSPNHHYYDKLLSPISIHLYANTSCLIMPYADLGTVKDLLALLVLKKVTLTIDEHELLVIYCAKQVNYVYLYIYCLLYR